MAVIGKTTWVQRRISPGLTWLSSSAYQNRNTIALGIRTLVQRFNEREKLSLRLFLNRYGVIQRKFRLLDLANLQHYHLKKNKLLQN